MYFSTEKEVWKDIEGYEGYYQISNRARVRSLDRIVESDDRSPQFIKGDIKKATVRGDGYKYVSLYKDNKRKNKYLHRLLAEAFIPNPKNLPIINHMDENPSNNKLKNLEWCDHQHNLTYGNKINKTLDSEGYQKQMKSMRKPIYAFDKKGNKNWFESITEACKALNLDNASVSACLSGRYKTHKGYSFKLANK